MSNTKPPAWRRARAIAVLSAVLSLAACGDQPQPGGVPEGMKIPVSVIQVQPAAAEVSVNLPGRVQAIREAEIRARVTGIVTEINFRQGSDVDKEDLLFTIDPASYQAARDQAEAQLMQAKADLQAAESLANRYTQLIKANAVSRQDYDNAMARAAQGRASVAAARAALDRAEIDLGYTHVTSPIAGRIGKSLVTEGALVSAASASLLAVVQQIDKVYIDLTRSSSQLARLRKAIDSGELVQSADGRVMVTIIQEDGTPYDHKGELLFSGISVDPGTGQVNLRAEVANPDQLLLPGMYVRVNLPQGTDDRALLVPDQAIQRGADGLNTLMLIKDDKVHPVAVTLGAQLDGHTIVTAGLEPGDVVIVEGFQKIRPGAPVMPMPWKHDPDAQQAGAQQGGAAEAGAAAGADAPAEAS